MQSVRALLLSFALMSMSGVLAANDSNLALKQKTLPSLAAVSWTKIIVLCQSGREQDLSVAHALVASIKGLLPGTPVEISFSDQGSADPRTLFLHVDLKWQGQEEWGPHAWGQASSTRRQTRLYPLLHDILEPGNASDYGTGFSDLGLEPWGYVEAPNGLKFNLFPFYSYLQGHSEELQRQMKSRDWMSYASSYDSTGAVVENIDRLAELLLNSAQAVELYAEGVLPIAENLSSVQDPFLKIDLMIDSSKKGDAAALSQAMSFASQTPDPRNRAGALKSSQVFDDVAAYFWSRWKTSDNASLYRLIEWASEATFSAEELSHAARIWADWPEVRPLVFLTSSLTSFASLTQAHLPELRFSAALSASLEKGEQLPYTYAFQYVTANKEIQAEHLLIIFKSALASKNPKLIEACYREILFHRHAVARLIPHYQFLIEEALGQTMPYESFHHRPIKPEPLAFDLVEQLIKGLLRVTDMPGAADMLQLIYRWAYLDLRNRIKEPHYFLTNIPHAGEKIFKDGSKLARNERIISDFIDFASLMKMTGVLASLSSSLGEYLKHTPQSGSANDQARLRLVNKLSNASLRFPGLRGEVTRCQEQLRKAIP